MENKSCNYCHYRYYCSKHCLDGKNYAEYCRFFKYDSCPRANLLALFFPKKFIKFSNKYVGKNKIVQVAICKPYLKHIFEKFPKDVKHIIHKFTLGVILVNHTEPNGKDAFYHHKKYILKVFEILL